MIRSLLPTSLLALVTLATLLGGLMLLSRMAGQQNARQAGAEKARVTTAVRDLHAQLGRDVARLSDLPSFDTPPADIGGIDEVLGLNLKGPDSVAVVGGTPIESADLNRSVLEFTRGISKGAATAASGMIAPGDLFDLVALSLPRSAPHDLVGPAKVIVGLRQIGPDYLALVSRMAGVKRLELIHRASDGFADGASSWSGGGWRGFGLIWQPSRPGDAFMLRSTVIGMALTSLLAVLMVLRARREAGRLHASEAQAVEASRNDWLSGLPNRVYFNHLLERDLKPVKNGTDKLALVCLDVDRFKDINDAFGLEIGDLMIQAVTRRIEAVLIDGQSLARFEGDAFSVLLPGIHGSADCEAFAERVQAAMKAPFQAGATTLSLSLSMGVAIAPDDATERAELIRLANLALYRAKREGRDRMALYRPDLHDEWRRRTLIEHALRHAIAHEGLVLRYQPIVECGSGRVVCAEALVRWNHPAEGLIAPDVFIGLAEDRGLIVPLGEWVLREACRAATGWNGVRVAVNVSPIQFREKDFVDTVLRIVAETGLDPALLELELTEGVLVEHGPETLAAMDALRHRGIRLAIDDFGTGYSSLIYLRRFSMDKIKIDRAFLDGLEPGSDAATLLTSVVQLGRDLGLTVTAEGIETTAQRDFLSHIGCHQLQGYLIARPMAEADFVALLRHDGDGGQATIPALAVA